MGKESAQGLHRRSPRLGRDACAPSLRDAHPRIASGCIAIAGAYRVSWKCIDRSVSSFVPDLSCQHAWDRSGAILIRDIIQPRPRDRNDPRSRSCGPLQHGGRRVALIGAPSNRRLFREKLTFQKPRTDFPTIAPGKPSSFNGSK